MQLFGRHGWSSNLVFFSTSHSSLCADNFHQITHPDMWGILECINFWAGIGAHAHITGPCWLVPQNGRDLGHVGGFYDSIGSSVWLYANKGIWLDLSSVSGEYSGPPAAIGPNVCAHLHACMYSLLLDPGPGKGTPKVSTCMDTSAQLAHFNLSLVCFHCEKLCFSNHNTLSKTQYSPTPTLLLRIIKFVPIFLYY